MCTLGRGCQLRAESPHTGERPVPSTGTRPHPREPPAPVFPRPLPTVPRWVLRGPAPPPPRAGKAGSVPAARPLPCLPHLREGGAAPRSSLPPPGHAAPLPGLPQRGAVALPAGAPSEHAPGPGLTASPRGPSLTPGGGGASGLPFWRRGLPRRRGTCSVAGPSAGQDHTGPSSLQGTPAEMPVQGTPEPAHFPVAVQTLAWDACGPGRDQQGPGGPAQRPRVLPPSLWHPHPGRGPEGRAGRRPQILAGRAGPGESGRRGWEGSWLPVPGVRWLPRFLRLLGANACRAA